MPSRPRNGEKRLAPTLQSRRLGTEPSRSNVHALPGNGRSQSTESSYARKRYSSLLSSSVARHDASPMMNCSTSPFSPLTSHASRQTRNGRTP
jgi:hypothetical protein